MQQITGFIIAFIFVGIVFPKLVKNMPLFYGALGVALIVILIESICSAYFNGFTAFLHIVEGVLDIAAILMLVMATGGQTLGELAGEMGKSIDAVRQNAAPAQTTAAPPAAPGAPAAAAPAAKPRIAMPPRKTSGDTSIPMD